MADKESEIRSVEKDLEILYNFKSVVQKIRSGDLSVKSKDIFEGYEKAVLVAAEENEKSVAAIFDELMRPIKESLTEKITEAAAAGPVTLPKGLEGLFDEGMLKEFNAVIAQIAKNKAEIQKLGTGGTKTSKSKPAAEPVEEDSLITRLKAEAIAGLEASKLALSDADKKKYAEIIRNASEIKVKRNGLKCEISVAGMDVTPSFGMTGRVGGLSSATKNGLPSSYGNLTKEDVLDLITIGEKKTRTLKTKSKAAAEKAGKKEAEIKKKTAARLMQLQTDNENLQNTAADTFKQMVAGMDGRVLFEALALNNKKGRDLLKLISPDTAKENGGLQDRLREDTLKACIWDKNVWSLYQEKDGRCFYDSLPEKIRPVTEVNDTVVDFMTNSELTKKEADKVIDKIAGNLLPREIAEEMFVKSVFSYGMGLSYRAQFKPENFENMNKVLEPFGYRVSMRSFTARRSCPEGAQVVSKAVLDEMHQKHTPALNKELALLYQMGALLADNKDYQFNRILEAKNKRLYEQFALLYYDARANKGADYISQWTDFVQDKENRKIALEVYNEFHKNYDNENTERRMIGELVYGRSGFKDAPLADNSIHHFWERKLAGVIEAVKDIVQKGSLFNAKRWLSTTARWHPADKDRHKLAHLLDTREIYLYKRGDKYHTGAISGIREGDEVLVPILEIADEKGNFHRAIDENTLLVSSTGATIQRPKVPGQRETENILSQNAAAYLMRATTEKAPPSSVKNKLRQSAVSMPYHSAGTVR